MVSLPLTSTAIPGWRNFPSEINGVASASVGSLPSLRKLSMSMAMVGAGSRADSRGEMLRKFWPSTGSAASGAALYQYHAVPVSTNWPGTAPVLRGGLFQPPLPLNSGGFQFSPSGLVRYKKEFGSILRLSRAPNGPGSSFTGVDLKLESQFGKCGVRIAIAGAIHRLGPKRI